ncbi:MAG: PaaI family thioesterase [Acidimicrobiales bacterium]
MRSEDGLRALSRDASHVAVRAFLKAAEPAALREAVGLTWQCLEPEHLVQSVSPNDLFAESDGRLSIGAIAVLADSTLGSAGTIHGGYRFGATVGLHVELAYPMADPPVPVLASASVVAADPAGCLVVGELTAPDGARLGYASLRAVAVDLRRAPTRAVSKAVGRAQVNSATAPVTPQRQVGVDSRLGVDVVEAAHGRSRLVVRVGAGLANGAGRLHGGIVASVAHRGARHAIVSAMTADESVHDLVLDVDLIRPVPPGGVVLEVHGAVQSRTRRYAWAESEVLLPDGKVAARSRVAAAIHPR